MSFSSETMKPVVDELDFGADYEEVRLLRQSPRGRIYTAVRAGKRFILKAAATDSGHDVSMLKREYELTLTLSHPGLAYVFTFEPSSPVGPCIVMEYVDGVTLREYLQQRPSQGARRRVFGQLLDALEYVHRHGVVHNDLSPENILITRADGDVKLIDFGFADDDTHYLAKSMGGTRAYAAPELAGGGAVDARSDVYTLGLLMREIFQGGYPRVSRRCCQADPDRRYASVADLRRAWKGYFHWLYCVLAAGVVAFVAVFSVQFYAQRSEFERQVEEYREASALEQSRVDSLSLIKTKVDEWYSIEIARYKSGIDTLKTEQERILFFGNFCDLYNAFWKETIKECPESLRPRCIDYIVQKYNSEFPLPPE